jgi:hypothetical protein
MIKPKNPNVYRNQNLKFSIEKPDDWIFLPQQWTANFRARSFKQNRELMDKFENGVLLFVIFHKPHDEPEYPYPTGEARGRFRCFQMKMKNHS